jgi:hypothetical protein
MMVEKSLLFGFSCAKCGREDRMGIGVLWGRFD